MPYSWIIRLLAVNEFSTPGPGGLYDQMIGRPGARKRTGDVYLDAFAIQNEAAWVGYGFVYLFGAFVVLFGVYTLGLHYRRLGVTRPVVNRTKTKRTIYKRATAAATGSGRLVAVAVGDEGDVDEDEVEEGRADAALTVLRGLSVQPPRVDLVLSSLGYTVPIKGKEDKVLLHDVNGVFRPGTMTALMGSSGAGESHVVSILRRV